MGKREKRLQITFRITPLAKERLNQVASLFNLKPAHYAKALLYRDLGLFTEPVDQRKRKRPEAGTSVWERDVNDEEAEEKEEEW